MAPMPDPITTTAAKRRRKATSLEASACTFAGLLAQKMDAQRGIATEYRTPET